MLNRLVEGLDPVDVARFFETQLLGEAMTQAEILTSAQRLITHLLEHPAEGGELPGPLGDKRKANNPEEHQAESSCTCGGYLSHQLHVWLILANEAAQLAELPSADQRQISAGFHDQSYWHDSTGMRECSSECSLLHLCVTEIVGPARVHKPPRQDVCSMEAATDIVSHDNTRRLLDNPAHATSSSQQKHWASAAMATPGT